MDGFLLMTPIASVDISSATKSDVRHQTFMAIDKQEEKKILSNVTMRTAAVAAAAAPPPPAATWATTATTATLTINSARCESFCGGRD